MVKTDLSYDERWAPEAVEECCALWELSGEERDALLRFKEKVSDLSDTWKNDPFEVVRFLKEFRFDLKTSEKKFRYSIQWRLENNADNILEEYTPPALYNYFPLGVLEGAGHDGSPIYVERSGAADTLGLLQRFGKEEMIQQAIWGKELMSRGPWQENWPHGRVKQFITILDIHGLNKNHLNPGLVPVGQAVTRLVQDNYPGFGKKILVIRAPFLFRFVWNIFKHFVDPNVKDVIEIATEKETKELLEKYMDLSVLPKEIVPEGRGKAVQGYEPVWEGGTLPPPSKDDQKRATPIFPSAAVETPKPDTPTTGTSSSTCSAPIFTFDKSPKPKTPVRSNTPVPPTLQLASSSSTEDTEKSWEGLPMSSPNPYETPDRRHGQSESAMDTCKSWESLPQLNSPRRNIQQAWTVTPATGPFSHDLQEVWKEDNLQEMGRLWNLSEDDLAKLRSLKESILDVHHWKNDPYEVIRFFKSYNGNSKIEDQFRKMIIWRVEQKMDHFLSTYGSPDPIFHHMPICVLKGLDKDQDPIYVDRIGVCDHHSLLRHVGQDSIVNYITFLRELNSQPSFWKPYEEETGHKVRSFTVIFDLEGLSGRHCRPAMLGLLKKISKLSQDYYSGWAKRILVIRAPPIFKLLYWKIVKKFFAPHVRKMIEFSQGDYMALLDKYIDREVLPPVICPESNGAAMPGYYENVKLEGGRIPYEAFKRSNRPVWESSQSVPVLSPASGLTPRERCNSDPKAPGSDDDSSSWGPLTPVTTTRLLLGQWDEEVEVSDEKLNKTEHHDYSIRAYATPEKPGHPNNPWQSPMFKYNW